MGRVLRKPMFYNDTVTTGLLRQPRFIQHSPAAVGLITGDSEQEIRVRQWLEIHRNNLIFALNEWNPMEIQAKFFPIQARNYRNCVLSLTPWVRKSASELNCSFERSISRLQTARGDKKPNLCKQTDCASHCDEFSREYRTLISSSLWTVQSATIADWAHSAKTNLLSSVVRDLVRCLMWPLLGCRTVDCGKSR